MNLITMSIGTVSPFVLFNALVLVLHTYDEDECVCSLAK